VAHAGTASAAADAHQEVRMADPIDFAFPRPVRVRLPPHVASKLELFQKAQLQILDRLGCPACCSGFDIRWDTVRDFVIDDRLKVHELGDIVRD
jgi:hypothetical protein